MTPRLVLVAIVMAGVAFIAGVQQERQVDARHQREAMTLMRVEYFRGAYDFCTAFYTEDTCMKVIRKAAATTEFYEKQSEGFDLEGHQRN